MATDISSCLQLDKQFEKGRVIVSKEINGCDSSFITSCILSHAIKNKKPVILVLLHNSLAHYHHVGLRMFYNLNKSIDSGLVSAIDFYKNQESNLDLTQGLLSEIHKNFQKMNDTFGAPISVLVDGLSHLFDLKFSLKEVNYFCKLLSNEVRPCSNSFVLFTCNIAGEDDVTYSLANLLAHKAHTVVEVETLSSGWSMDVSGHLRVINVNQKYCDNSLCSIELKPLQYLFKLFDKGVKLLAPGTV